MVAYNEEGSLGSILSDIISQTYSHAETELVFVDNASTDGTYGVLCAFRDEHISEYKDIKVLKNTQRVLPSGLNLGIDAYEGEAFVRIDAHASIAPDFVEETVACLEGTYTGIKEYVCGGVRPTYTDRKDGVGALLLAAEESRFGASAASYRGEPERCYVDSIFHAAYRREVIDKVGKFDTRLSRTEDNDYNFRVRECGYKICFEPRIKSKQQIRNTLSKMLSQKNQNGYWVGFTLGICPGCLSLFHFVPFAFLFAIIGGVLLSSLGMFMPNLLLLIPNTFMWGAYWLCNLMFSIKAIASAKKFSAHLLLLPFLFLLMHICYGAGTAKGLFVMIFKKLTGRLDKA